MALPASRPLRILLIAALAVVFLFSAAWVAVRVAFPPAKIAELVRTQGSAALGREVTVERVGISVFPRLAVGVRGLRLANDSGFSAEPAVSLRSLDLSVSWLSLLTFSPRIHEVRLVEPDILFEVDAAGRDNLASLGGAPDSTDVDTAAAEAGLPELPVALALKAFVIDDGRVRYRDLAAGTEVTLGRIDQRASLSLDSKLSDVRTAGTLTISEISLSDGASGIRKGGVRISVSHDLRVDLPGDSLRVNAVDIAFQDVKVNVAGSLTGFSAPAPVADLRVSAPEISLASLFAEIPPEISPELRKLSVAGTAAFDLRVQGALDTNPAVAVRAVSLDASVRDGSFGHRDVPQGVEAFTVDFALRGDSAHLKELSFRTGPNPFKVEALLTGVLDSIPYLRALTVDGELDLGNLVSLAHKMELLDPAIRVKGRQTLKLEASGPLDPARPQRLSAKGRSELIGIEAQLPDLPTVSLHGVSNIDNETIRQQLSVRFGQSDVTLGVLVRGYLALLLPEAAGGRRAHLGVEVRSALLDLDELLPKTGSDAPDTTEPLVRYPDWLPLDADISVRLDRTRLLNLDMTAFALKAVARETGATVNLGGTLYTGKFSGDLAVTPRDTTDWAFGFKLNVDKVEANDFISRLNDRVPLQNKLLRSLAGTDSAVFGKFTLALDLKTRGLPAAFAENLSGPIVFAITDGRIVGVEWTQSLSGALAKAHSSLGYEELVFSRLKGDLLAQDGKLLVRDFSFDSPRAGAARATGTIGFDNTLDLELTQALPPAATGLVTGAGNALLGLLRDAVPGAPAGSLFPTDAQGRALLYFLVDGELSSPRFALDARRMAAEGSGNAAAAAARDAARAAAEAAARKLQSEAAARAAAEKAKLEAAAEAERKRLQQAADAEKKKLQEKAAEEAKKQGTKLLDGLRK